MALFSVASPPLIAGDVAGLRPSLPPFLDRDFEVSFSNDVLGRGGSVDDFRTQQFVFAADFAERWTAVMDHSVLTLSDPNTAGRIEQLSVSTFTVQQSNVALTLGVSLEFS